MKNVARPEPLRVCVCPCAAHRAVPGRAAVTRFKAWCSRLSKVLMHDVTMTVEIYRVVTTMTNHTSKPPAACKLRAYMYLVPAAAAAC